MERITNRLLSAVLAVIFSLGVFVLPNGISRNMDITAFAAEKILAAPKLVSVEKGYSSLTVTWSEVKGANAYYVYIKQDGEDEYVKYRTTSKTTCKISGDLKPGTVYNIKITPIKIGEDKKLKATGRSLAVKANTKKYNDTLKNITYTPTEIVWADMTAFGGGIYSGDPATAYFTLSWDDLKDVNYKSYAIYFRIPKWVGYDEIPADAKFSHENGRTVAKIGYSCGSKVRCVIYPMHGDVKGKGTVVNFTTYAPNVTSINLAEHGFVKGKNNTYYDVSDRSLLSVGLSVSLILGSYGYDLSYNNSASSNTKLVYKVNCGSLTVGTLTMTKTASGVTIVLKDSGNHIMYVESPKTAQIYL